ncbi:MAG: hypothetical protein KAT17_10720 [Candidatus Aminicenantes bacterium]|nr:hypothetical protein [Candidatus Aminicenantes bacterium]
MMSRLKILFVVDKFDDVMRDRRSPYPGGAEMTDAALIEVCPWKVEPVRIKELKPGHLSGFDIHILGNLSLASRQQIRDFCLSGRHILFEHDVRICRYRGNFPEAKEPIHRFTHRCICPHFYLRSLYRSALGVIFLTHRQMATYHTNPFFSCSNKLVLGSSVMNRAFFKRVDQLPACPDIRKQGTCVAFSRGPIKGFKRAMKYCRDHGITPRIIKDLRPDQILDIFEQSRRFVFLPLALEPAGRMPVEARLLGCEVVVNQYVGVAGEAWWNGDDDQALEFVKDTPARFWRQVRHLYDMNISHRPD